MSQKSKKSFVRVLNPIDGHDRYSLAHARRVVRQGGGEWQGACLYLLTVTERIERAVVRPSVAVLRASGIAAVNMRQVKAWNVVWPAQLTVIERARQAEGKLGEDPTEFRSYARYPDARRVAELRREAE